MLKMASMKYRLPSLTFSFLLFTGAALAQTGSLQGIVKDESGQPLKDALVKIDRKDIKGHYEVKTKKKGDYFHTGLPLGTYRVSVVIDGKERDAVDNVRTKLGEPVDVNFDLHQAKQQSAELQKAAETGTLTAEQQRGMSAEQKAQIEKQMKERAAALSKNKELNDAFNQGMEAKNAKNWDAAVQGFEKAVALDPSQNVIWGNMAESYMEIAKVKTGAEQQAAMDKAVEAYKKAIEIAPTDANYHNNYAIALAKMKKFPEMEAELNKAIELDPGNKGRYYYNLGAILVNANQTPQACDAFQKSIGADPNYADAYYQYGICLTAKATTDKEGKLQFPQGTAEAFQKYLELKPTGPYSDSAKAMLQTMGSTIETKYVAPGAEKPAAKTRKK
jgi:tetratricopeptide (TPR) repeat protein